MRTLRGSVAMLVGASAVLVGCARDPVTAGPDPSLPPSAGPAAWGLDSLVYNQALFSLWGPIISRAGVTPWPGDTSSATTPGLFADSVLGAAYVIDCGAVQKQWKRSTVTSGPPDGIRLELYPPTDYGLPDCPATSYGHVDIRDVGTAASPAARLIATSADSLTAIFDYTVTRVAGDWRYAGYLANGARRLDFTLLTRRTASETRDSVIIARVGAQASLESVGWAVPGQAGGGHTTFHLGDDVIVVHDTSINLTPGFSFRSHTVTVNGALFGFESMTEIRISRGPNGRLLTDDELDILVALHSARDAARAGLLFMLQLPVARLLPGLAAGNAIEGARR